MDASLPLRVTILINTYNYARYLDRAIESALQQEYEGPVPEILVVDDGSIDDTAAIVRRYRERVRYIAKENGGQASALNTGFQKASGDIVCLLDGDDYFYPGKVQAVSNTFQRHPEVGLVYNEFDIVDGTGRSLDKARPEPTWTGQQIPLSTVPGQLRSLILLGHPWTCITSAMSVRRRLLVGLEVPEDDFRHSPDLFLGLVLPFMTEVAIVEMPATAYVFHGNNVGLFRSSAENQALYARQLNCIRRFVEEHFPVHFVDYRGRAIYGPGVNGWRGTRGLAGWGREFRHIQAAAIDGSIKRDSQVKLLASLLLTDRMYLTLQRLRAAYRTWRTREYRRRIERVRGKEEAID